MEKQPPARLMPPEKVEVPEPVTEKLVELAEPNKAPILLASKLPPVKVKPLEEERPAVDNPPEKVEVAVVEVADKEETVRVFEVSPPMMFPSLVLPVTVRESVEREEKPEAEPLEVTFHVLEVTVTFLASLPRNTLPLALKSPPVPRDSENSAKAADIPEAGAEGRLGFALGAWEVRKTTGFGEIGGILFSIPAMAESTASATWRMTWEDIVEFIAERAKATSPISRFCILDSAEERRERTEFRDERIGARVKKSFSVFSFSRPLSLAP